MYHTSANLTFGGGEKIFGGTKSSRGAKKPIKGAKTYKGAPKNSGDLFLETVNFLLGRQKFQLGGAKW